MFKKRTDVRNLHVTDFWDEEGDGRMTGDVIVMEERVKGQRRPNFSKKKALRRKKAMIRKIRIASVIAVIVLILVALGIHNHVWAANTTLERSYYSYEVQPGDSLWEIASIYAPSCNMSVKSYMKEVKEMNHITNNQIVSGKKLIIFTLNE